MAKTAEERVERLKGLFNEVETELRFFRDGTKQDRKKYERAFANGNTGYISSLMKALAEEERFQNWLAFTTWKFRKFR